MLALNFGELPGRNDRFIIGLFPSCMAHDLTGSTIVHIIETPWSLHWTRRPFLEPEHVYAIRWCHLYGLSGGVRGRVERVVAREHAQDNDHQQHRHPHPLSRFNLIMVLIVVVRGWIVIVIVVSSVESFLLLGRLIR